MSQVTSRSILVPVDFSSASEAVVAYARALAASDDELVLVHVIPPPEVDASSVPLPEDKWQTQRLAYEAADGALRDLASRTAWPGRQVRTEVSQGDAAEEIALQALARGAAMIVMATHGRGAAGRLAFGSVADRVARQAPVPVLLVRAQAGMTLSEPARLSRIVVPMDGSEAARTAMPVAAALARQHGVPVALINVRELNRAALVPSPVVAATIYDLEDPAAEQAQAEMLREVAAPLAAEGIETSWQIFTGPIAPTIADQIEPTDLVVMTSHGHGGIRRWLLGSVAEHLVRHAPAPVLLVPPAERVLSATAEEAWLEGM